MRTLVLFLIAIMTLAGCNQSADRRAKVAKEEVKDIEPTRDTVKTKRIADWHQFKLESDSAIANDIFCNTTGNSGLAKGGSGDALTGLITAFLAQGYTPLSAACVGVYIHGVATDITLKTQSKESMIITDIIKNFGKAFKKIRT